MIADTPFRAAREAAAMNNDYTGKALSLVHLGRQVQVELLRAVLAEKGEVVLDPGLRGRLVR
jgi:hypothetical protein